MASIPMCHFSMVILTHSFYIIPQLGLFFYLNIFMLLNAFVRFVTIILHNLLFNMLNCLEELFYISEAYKHADSLPEGLLEHCALFNIGCFT
jgi:hypothetical protein